MSGGGKKGGGGGDGWVQNIIRFCCNCVFVYVQYV